MVDPPQLIVWHDDPEAIVSRAEQIESLLVSMLWKDNNMLETRATSPAFPDSMPGTPLPWAKQQTMRIKEKEVTDLADAGADEEMVFYDGPRKTLLYQSILMGLVGVLIIAAVGVGWRKVAIEVKVDSNYLRFAFLAVFPAQVWLGWFFFQTLVNGVSQMIGPVNQILSNSRSYSGIRSKRLNADKQQLPHVTVQCPVYKEGLDTVIEPTMVSIRQAISTYEMQGGTANIFVNDDGLQLVSEEEARARRDYYDEHNIGWVARPKHNPKPAGGEKGFVRPGKFKKASNMNYAMNVSARVEDKLKLFQRPYGWTQQDEEAAYKNALAKVTEEDQGRTWADGDIRMGDYILIIDSDTRVPEDCFLDAVSEMEQSPRVAIIQFSSGVMNVTESFFEKGITYFTNLVYTAIQFAVSNGDVAPFVGHNAILRWSALQDIGYEEEGVEKWWAETTVSEDFDMALRLQSKGYDLRFSTYFGRGFEEGVSLTVYDELARWEKYAYGCSELIFQPFRYWFTRGPVTPLFRRFIMSNMPVMAKITILSYIGTYYAIGSAWALTTLNYFLIGWFNGYLDHYYVESFKILFSIVIVFQALGIVSLAVLRYRVEGRSLLGAFFENLKWLPLLTIFLGGISLHVCQAIACHMFSIDMSWGATSKEAKRTSFFEEVPTILKKFKFTFAFCIIMIAAMIVLAGVGPLGAMIPHDFQIKTFTATFPLAVVVSFHFIMPLVLNPGKPQLVF